MEEINIRRIFGENVKYHRKKRNLSQEQLAELLEISTNHLSVIETGTKFVTYKLLEKIVKELKVLPASLFYCSEIAEKDDSNINIINTIISEELAITNSKIQNRLRDIL